MLAAVALTPQLLGSKIGDAVDGLSAASPGWLWLAGLGFAVSLAASAAAWRVAGGACGCRLTRADAAASYACGSLVNSVTPAKLGDAVRIALWARSLDGPQRLWKASGIFAALAAARSLALALLVVVDIALGAFPLWTIGALAGVAAVLGVIAYLTRNDTRHRFARLFDALAELERSPRAALALLGWVAVSTLARVGAAAAIAAAFGVAHPLLAAILIVPALDLAGLVPLTPGNVGVTSGAVAMALQARGIRITEALTAGIALHAAEMMVGLALGTAGSLYLVRARAPVTLRLAGAGAVVALGFAVGATMTLDFL